MHSIGIIGGADGPTAVLVTSGFSWELALLIGVCVIAAFVIIKLKK